MNRSFAIVALVLSVGCSAASPDPVTGKGALTGGGSSCSANACGDKPEIDVVCADGSTGELVCRESGGKCGWTEGCPGGASVQPSPVPTAATCGASSCGPKPEILPICSDGAVGDLDCRAGQNNACGWQSTCADDPNTPVSNDDPNTPSNDDPNTPVSNDAGPLPPVSNDAGSPSCGASACGPKPEIGVICNDNSVGDLVCAPFNGTCDWVRSCQ